MTTEVAREAAVKSNETDPVLSAWNTAPMGRGLTPEEEALADEGVVAIERGEVASSANVRAILQERRQLVDG